jgi:hypothetical protein
MTNIHYEYWKKTANLPLGVPTPEEAWNGAIEHAVKIVQMRMVGVPQNLVDHIVAELRAK